MAKLFKIFAALNAVIVLAIAGAVYLGWVTHDQDLVRLVPGPYLMQPNTAICFLILGVVYFLRDTPKLDKFRAVGCGFVIVIGCLTALEYLLNRNIGIDTLVLNPFLVTDPSHPGRMALNSCLGIVISALAFVVWRPDRTEHQLTVTCALALISGSLGFVALLGHLFSLETAYGWYGYTKMSATTAAALCAISLAQLVQILAESKVTQSRAWWASMSSLLLGINITIILWAFATASQARLIERQVAFDAKTTVSLLRQQINNDVQLLKSVERFFAGSSEVSYDEFRIFTSQLLAEHSSILGVDWTPRVSQSERSAFEAAMQKKGLKDYRFLQLDGAGRTAPRVENEIYFPVQFTEPIISNRAALGFDHYSDPRRRLTMDEAIRLGVPRSTPLFTLFRVAPGKFTESDFLIVVPAFGGNSESDRPIGFVIGVFRTSDIVQAALKNSVDVGLDMKFYATDSTGQSTSFYQQSSLEEEIDPSVINYTNEFSHDELLDVVGNVWKLKFNPNSQYLYRLRSWYPLTVLLSGLIITCLISIYILSLHNQNSRISHLVEARTAELSTLNQELEQRVDSRTRDLVTTNQQLASEVQERKQIEDRLREEAVRQGMVVAIQQTIACAGNQLPTVMRTLMERTQELTNASGAVIEMVDGEDMVYTAVSGSAEPFLHLRINRQGSLSGECVRQHRVLLCNDSETDPRVNREACRKVGLRSMVAVPLQRGTKANGVLKVLSPEPNAFDQRHVMNLQMIAGVMSVALENASSMQALAEKNSLLETATRFKSQFLANMSHEIRTPLTSIIGYSESLMHDTLSREEQMNALSTVIRNSNHLLGVINDILDFSKIEAGKLEVEPTQVELFELLEDVGKVMGHKAQDKEIGFDFRFAFPLPKVVRTDPLRLKQILFNLIGNAIKFTNKGSVTVQVTADFNTESLTFAIADTGIGLTAVEKERLFKAFSQADTSTTRRFGGTGLGLAISKQLAEMLGGDISVDSIPGQGSTFTASISTGPIEQSQIVNQVISTRQDDPPTVATNPIQLGGKLLVAEDGPDNQKYISYILSRSGINFVMVDNGYRAVEALSQEKFDLVLMDMQMPVMDGYSATRMLRKTGINVPIVALTANTMKQDIDRCMEAGCTDFLGKPFERKAFFEKLAEYLPTAEAWKTQPLVSEASDPEILPLVQEFVKKLHLRLDEFQQAVSQTQWDTAQNLAHRLRSAGLFGFPLLAEKAGNIEDAIKGGSYSNELFVELQGVVSRIRQGNSAA